MRKPLAESIVVLAICLLACGGRKRAQPPPPGPVEWVREPLPSSAPNVAINAIAGTAADDVWAVGWGIYHYDGKAWTNATPPELTGSSTALSAMSVASKNDIWAVGVYGHIAHYDGKTWHGEQLDEARIDKTGAVKGWFDLIGVAAWPGEVWVSSAAKSYYRFDGKTWSTVTTVPYGIHEMWGTSPRDVWLPGGRPAHFDGTRWDTSVVLSNSMRSVHGAAPNDVWMVGWGGSHKDNKGAAAHFDGTTWRDVPVPTGTALLWTVYAARPNEAYAVGDDGWAIAWNGSSRRPSATGVTGTLKAIYSPGGGVAFAGGDIGAFVLHKR